MIVPDRLPVLSRLLLFAFLWVFFLAGCYLLLDSVDLWARLPAALTHGVDVATGLALALALLAHLALATGALPREGDGNG